MSDAKMTRCYECYGRGKRVYVLNEETCRRCLGTGRLPVCPRCEGEPLSVAHEDGSEIYRVLIVISVCTYCHGTGADMETVQGEEAQQG